MLGPSSRPCPADTLARGCRCGRGGFGVGSLFLLPFLLLLLLFLPELQLFFLGQLPSAGLRHTENTALPGTMPRLDGHYPGPVSRRPGGAGPEIALSSSPSHGGYEGSPPGSRAVKAQRIREKLPVLPRQSSDPGREAGRARSWPSVLAGGKAGAPLTPGRGDSSVFMPDAESAWEKSAHSEPDRVRAGLGAGMTTAPPPGGSKRGRRGEPRGDAGAAGSKGRRGREGGAGAPGTPGTPGKQPVRGAGLCPVQRKPETRVAPNRTPRPRAVPGPRSRRREPSGYASPWVRPSQTLTLAHCHSHGSHHPPS